MVNITNISCIITCPLIGFFGLLLEEVGISCDFDFFIPPDFTYFELGVKLMAIFPGRLFSSHTLKCRTCYCNFYEAVSSSRFQFAKIKLDNLPSCHITIGSVRGNFLITKRA